MSRLPASGLDINELPSSDVSKILCHFPKFTPPTKGMLSLQSERISFIKEGAHMLPEKYQPNWSGVLEKMLECFYIIQAWRPPWILDHDHFNYFGITTILITK